MDFVRKLVRGSSVMSPHTAQSTENTYELIALRRKFLEVCQSQRPASSKEHEDKIYSMLPLFYEVFNDAPPRSMREKFGDVLQFATQVSRLMVTEIRRRAPDKTTDQASADIAEFLIVQESEEKSRGWLLLNVIAILASGGQNIVDCMTTMHLPSTLVRCLYLFFDLPAIDSPPDAVVPVSGTSDAGHEPQKLATTPQKKTRDGGLHTHSPAASSPKYAKFQQRSRVRAASSMQGKSSAKKDSKTPSIMEYAQAPIAEKRLILHKVFVQILVRLCKHISPAEELSHRDDLVLLPVAVTSLCPPHNVCWRQAASEVLSVISRHGLSHNVVQYIRSKRCVATCVDNLRELMRKAMESHDGMDSSPEDGNNQMSVVDLVGALVSVMRFVRDTSDVTQMILEDFRQCNGYGFLIEFLLRLELLVDRSENHREALRSIISNLEILATCGFVELSPGPTVQASPFQASFEVPVPVGKGASVRNLQAFQVLEQTFIRGRTSLLCQGVLDGVLNVYRRDPANYFILAGQHTLSTFAEPLMEKPVDVLPKFFSLLEFVALDLSYVPCKELISITLMIKDDRSPKCSIACVESLRKILSSNAHLYKDVYRDVGVLEVLVTCLHKYAAILKSSDELEENRTLLGHAAMELLAELIKGCPANAGVFRETGGARCAHNLVPFEACRSRALSIVQALILQPPGSSNDDDDMGTLLGLLSTVPPKDLALKTDILRTLLKVTTESKDARIIFRKVGGFINVISVLVSVEGCLEDPPVGLWESLPLQDVLKLLEVTFQTLCVALRLPSNKRFFHAEVRFESLRSAVQYLGCFTEDSGFRKGTLKPGDEEELSTYGADIGGYPKPMDPPIISAPLGSLEPTALLNPALLADAANNEILTPNCISVLAVFQFLHRLATDSFKDEVLSKIQQLEDQKSSSSASPDSVVSLISPSRDHHHKNIPNCCHSSVVNIMLLLVPSIPPFPSRQTQINLQYYILEEINSLLNLERNEQILCRSGLLSTLLRCYSAILTDDTHPLNPTAQRIMERLATQTVTPKELRDFLRIGDPLHCKDAMVSSGSVSLSRVKNLVSMSTPRNMGFQEDGAVNYFHLPGFLEFDMSVQGCSYLFIPSLFPQTASNASVVGQMDANVISGIGTGERAFPPPAGLTVSTWVYIDKFCQHKLHPIRLLTVTREIAATQVQYACLSIHISAKDKNIIISTHEEELTHMGPGDLESGNELISATATFPTNHSIHEGQWYHIAVVINKATVLKHSATATYLNGRLLGTSKLRYIHTSPGGNASVAANSAIMVRAYVGTPPCLSARSPLLWRTASMHITDDSSFLTAAMVTALFQLGPSYVGNFQSIALPDGTTGAALSEEHLCFSLYPHACETASIAKLRRECLKMDSKAAAKELNLRMNDGLTPILLVRNACSHMPGLARSIGALSVFDQASAAVRDFIPGQVARVLQNVGGTAIILSLVSMATDVESLYAAVKSLVCIVKNNEAAAREMDRKRGYQALAMHLKRKKHLLNSHVLHLTYSLAGTVDAGRESASIPNVAAFEDLLCDLEVWHNAPNELHKSLFEHIHELLTESSDTNENCRIIRERGMVKRCLHFVLGDAAISYGTTRSIFRIVQTLLNSPGYQSDLLRFGQFLVMTIPPIGESESTLELRDRDEDFKTGDSTTYNNDASRMTSSPSSARTVHLRNMGLRILRECLHDNATGGADVNFCEDLQRTLGWDWVLLFMQQHLHQSTVVEALLLLLEMLRCGSTGNKSTHHSSSSSSSLSTAALSAPSLVASATGAAGSTTTYGTAYERFKHGDLCGAWLDGTEAILENSAECLLGFNVGSGEDKPYRPQVCREACSVQGFQALTIALLQHMNCPRLYITLLQFAVSDKLSEPPNLTQIDLDTMYELIFGLNANGSNEVADSQSKIKPSSSFGSGLTVGQVTTAMSLEIFQVALSLVRSMMNQNWKIEPSSSWVQTYPIVILQTLIFIYQFNYNGLASAFTTQDFITYLAATLFPKNDEEQFVAPTFSSSYTNTKSGSNDRSSPMQENPSFPNYSPSSGNKEASLSSHPCKKFVFNLLQMIMFDSLAQSSNSGKQGQVIDIILEFSVERCTLSQLKEFQTDIINHLFSNLIAGEPFMGETGALLTHGNHSHGGSAAKKGSSTIGSAYSNLQQNVTYFASRVVDRVWLDMFTQDVRLIFEFVRKLLIQSRSKASHCPTSLLDSLYRSLYRVVLYQLSRRHQSVSEQMTVLDALHSLTTNRELIFDAKRNDHLFISGLCHCLFMLSGDSAGVGFGVEEEQRQTTWHVINPDFENPGSGSSVFQFVSGTDTTPVLTPKDDEGDGENQLAPGQPTTPQEKGKLLLSKAAARVWAELMLTKKQQVEEIFKVSFHDLGSSQSNLDSARMRIKDAAAKSWSGYLALEKKGQAATKEVFYVNKFTKRMSSLAMLGGSRKTKKETSSRVTKQFSIQDNSLWALNHMTIVQDLVNFQHNSYRQDQDHLVRYADEEWTEIEKELVRERGVWGPDRPTPLHKWMLDSTEGPCRMRKKLMRNDSFYEHYPHRTKEEVVLLRLKHRKPISKDSIKQYRHINSLPEDYEDDSMDSLNSSPKVKMAPIAKQESDRLSDDGTNDTDACTCENTPTENATSVEDTKEKAADRCENEVNERNTQNGTVENGLDVTLTDKSESTTETESDNSLDEEFSGQEEVDKTFTDGQEETTVNEDVAASEDLTDKEESGDTLDNLPCENGLQESSKNEKDVTQPAQELPTSESQASLVEQENRPDNQTVLRLLEEGEKIRHMFRCARVQGLDTYEGLLLFGKENFYIIDGFTMLKSKEIREISSLPGMYHEPIIPQSSRPGHNAYDLTTPSETSSSSSSYSHLCSRFSYDHIREVHKRRYLLQNIALEVFSNDGRNYLLVFPQGTRNKVYHKFVSFATTLADDSKDLVIGQKSNVNIEQQGPALLTNIIGEKTVTQRWERGEISNFQYLMYINTLTGRSYNDLMQYPVFPWVVADYTSEVLDLTNPKTFRDFSKPMGAQTPDRLMQFKKRYREWEDLGGETPPYHYGTHYSSAMIVASYLVRMEPFTQHFLRLQGGHFDLADRMFHSISDAWHSASEKNMADVKELIPEFFYLPEFLHNSNNFDLGQKQNGIQLGDVILPPWAKGSSREFIRVHREALECDYVSAHLHEWIDLVFGYKQKGDMAFEANNVFHHLFYEGEVDIYSIDDPLKRSAAIGFINNFGQIPKHLFKKPHVQKKISLKPVSQEQEVSSALSLSPSTFGIGPPLDKVFYRHLDNLKSSTGPVKELKTAVGEIVVVDRGAFAVEQNRILVPPQYSRYLGWGHGDCSIRIGYYESERAMQVFENLDSGEIKCVAMPNDKTLVTGGTSSVVCIWKLPGPKDKIKTLQLKQSLYAHTDTITCIASCSAYGILVSGSQDCTCVVWNLNRLCFVRQLRGHKQAVSHACINELTGDIVTSDGTYVHMWSINGDHVASVNTVLMNARRQRITALAVSKLNEWDMESVIATGHTDGYVRFWRLEYVQVPESTKSSGQEDDSRSVKSAGHVESAINKKNFTLAHDVKSLDSLSLASGLVSADFAISEKAQSLDSLEQGQLSARGPDKQTHPAADALSILSMGELAVLPWSDVPALEVEKKTHGETPQEEKGVMPVVKNIGGNSSVTLVSSNENLSKAGVETGPFRKNAENIVASYVQVFNSKNNESPKATNEKRMSPSHQQNTQQTKGPQSPTEESFVMVNKEQIETQLAKEARILLPGFVWQEQLILKGKLQVEQAIDRTGRPIVPEVTAIAMSKDHHKLYVGDKMGRIYSWMSAD